ncbi:hypothetical protein H0H93_005579 [Arthromyces matolae]|nr:hypothetical protein H0H93_005579 [Arthromyces matolae]
MSSINQVPTMQEPSVSEPTAASDDIAPEVPDTVQREKILEDLPASEIAAEDVSASVSEDQAASTAGDELVTASAADTNEVPAPVEEEAAPHTVEKPDETPEVTVPVVVDAVAEETQIATPGVQEQIAASAEEQHTAASIPCPPVVKTQISAAGVEEFVQTSDAVVVEVPVVAEEPVLPADPSEESPVSVLQSRILFQLPTLQSMRSPSIVEETQLPVKEESSASNVAEQEQTTTALNEEPVPCTVHAAEVPVVVEVATVEEDISASDSSASEVPANTINAPLAPAIVEERTPVEEHTPVAEPQAEKIGESILAFELTVDEVAAHVEEAHVATVSIEEPIISADAEVPEAEPTTALDDGAVTETVVPAISDHRAVEPDSKHDESDLVEASNASTELATEPTEDASQDKLSSLSAVDTTPEEPVLSVEELAHEPNLTSAPEERAEEIAQSADRTPSGTFGDTAITPATEATTVDTALVADSLPKEVTHPEGSISEGVSLVETVDHESVTLESELPDAKDITLLDVKAVANTEPKASAQESSAVQVALEEGDSVQIVPSVEAHDESVVEIQEVLEVGSSVDFASDEATPHPELTLPHDEHAAKHPVVDEAKSNPTSVTIDAGIEPENVATDHDLSGIEQTADHEEQIGATAIIVDVTKADLEENDEETLPLNVATDIERPKSPWTTSFQVTTVGRGSPEAAAEECKDGEPVDAAIEEAQLIGTTPESELKNPAPEEVVTDKEQATILLPKLVIEDSSLNEEPADDLVAASGNATEEPPRPWTPSYSVHSQGSPRPEINGVLEPAAEDEDQPPRPWTPSYSVHSQGSPLLPPKADLIDEPASQDEVLADNENEAIDLEEIKFADNEDAPTIARNPATTEETPDQEIAAVVVADEPQEEEQRPVLSEKKIIEDTQAKVAIPLVDIPIPQLVVDDAEATVPSESPVPVNEQRATESWVPSYSVSVQGTPSHETPNPFEDIKSDLTTTLKELRDDKSEPSGAEQVQVDVPKPRITKDDETADLSQEEPDHVTVNSSTASALVIQEVSDGSSVAPSEVPVDLKEQDSWTPSYSVTSQGSLSSAVEPEPAPSANIMADQPPTTHETAEELLVTVAKPFYVGGKEHEESQRFHFIMSRERQILQCKVEREQPPRTDHFTIVTILDIAVEQKVTAKGWNLEVDWWKDFEASPASTISFKPTPVNSSTAPGGQGGSREALANLNCDIRGTYGVESEDYSDPNA